MVSALKCILPHIFCHFVTRHASFVISSLVYHSSSLIIRRSSFISSPVSSLVTRQSSVMSHASSESYKRATALAVDIIDAYHLSYERRL